METKGIPWRETLPNSITSTHTRESRDATHTRVSRDATHTENIELDFSTGMSYLQNQNQCKK